MTRNSLMKPANDPLKATLMAGATAVDITPPGSFFLFGYPHVPRYSTGTHDPLECAVLYLKSGQNSALFMANDVIGFGKSFVEDLRRRIKAATGVAEESIMISATHTHSGPIMVDYVSNAADPHVPKVDPSHVKLIADRMLEAAKTAVKNAVPAEVGLAVARAEGVGSNRHNPTGPADPEVPVLVARSLDNKTPIGCMVVYGMHPTVLHEDTKLVTGDFPYFARRWVQDKILTPGCPVIYHNGVSGNQSPRHVTKGNTFAEAQRIGEKLGQSIANVIPGLKYHRDLPITFRRVYLELTIREFPKLADAEKRVEQVHALFEKLKKEGAPSQAVRTAECDVFGAEETKQLAKIQAEGRLKAVAATCSPMEIQVIQIGQWKFAAWPGEFFVEYGLTVKSRVPDTFIVTIANGELQGYIVTAEAEAKGVYESGNAVFAPSNGPRVVDATVALLQGK